MNDAASTFSFPVDRSTKAFLGDFGCAGDIGDAQKRSTKSLLLAIMGNLMAAD